MEEILASIKRVIADDGRPAPTGRGRKASAGDSEAAAPGAVQPPAIEADDDILELSNPLPAEGDGDGLISENVTAATRNSLATLAAMRQQHPRPAESGPVAGEGPLEAVVRDMLRPLLKEWLDTRLPEMVEDMVAREIARITGKSL